MFAFTDLFSINWFEFRVQVRSTGFGPLTLVNHGVIFLFLSNLPVFLDSFARLGSARRPLGFFGGMEEDEILGYSEGVFGNVI